MKFFSQILQYVVFLILLTVPVAAGVFDLNQMDKDLDNLMRAQQLAHLERGLRDALDLIVTISGSIDGDLVSCAGIIFGMDNNLLYIMTANHSVRHGPIKATNIRIGFRNLPHQSLNARLLDFFDSEFDLAVLTISSWSEHGIDACNLPFLKLKKIENLKRGDSVFPVGNPNGLAWIIPVVPDKIAKISKTHLYFQSNFISVGHSGGALLLNDGGFIGMIIKDQPPFGVATALTKIVERLKRWGLPVDLDFFHFYSKGPGFKAVRKGDFHTLQALIESVCVTQEYLNDLLQMAGEMGQTDIAELLLRKGANPDYDLSRPYGGGTALARAACGGHVDTLKLLLEAGANPELGYRDESPLHILSYFPEEMRTKADPDPNCKTCLKPFIPVVDTCTGGENPEIVHLLVQAGVDLNKQRRDGRTALHIAEEWGSPDFLRMLLKFGANPDIKDSEGNTALDNARKARRSTNVKILLQGGAKIHSPD